MSTETNFDSEAWGQNFIKMIDGMGDGPMHKTAAAASMLTRRRVREDAFSPAVLPHEEVGNGDLSYVLDTERPVIICEMEPDSAGAKTISFNDTADQAEYYLDKYLLVFYTNTTPEWTKNVNFLRTYRADLRELITDNSLRDLSRQKDVKFMADVNAIVGVKAGGISPKTGYNQNTLYPGRMTKDNWISSTLLLGDRDLLNGVFLCNRRTFAEIRRWGRDEFGGDFAQELTLKGSAAFEKAEMSNINFIVTMKQDLVPNGVMYEFAPPNYLGRAAVLQQPTMSVEKRHDILRFSCREILGVAIGNMAAIQKVTFQDIANATGGDGRLPATV